MRKGSTVLLLLIAALVAAYWLFLRDRPENRIRRQTETIRELVSKTPGESDLEGLGRARKISSFFSQEFEVEAPQFNFSTRDRRTLAGFIHRYRSGSSVIAARVIEQEIGLDESSEHATSHITAQFLTGTRDLTGTETYRFQLNWRREPGGWKLDYVRLLEIMGK